MLDDIAAARDAALGRLGALATPEDLREAEAELVGKRSALGALKTRLGGLEPDQRRTLGQALNAAQQEVATALAARRAELEAAARRSLLEGERLDLTEVVGHPSVGHLHLVTQTRDRLEDVFVGMGFTVAEGPEVETDWYNFEALNLPPAHPARSMWDTLYVELGTGENVLLRTHTSPVQVRVMQEQAPPIYSVMPGRVFRRDTADATHLPVFHQIEGLVVDRGISMADLFGTIQQFTDAFFGPGFTARFRPSYFPFTEPSGEFDIQRPDGSWLELGGCGMVHPNVLRAVDLDPEEWSGFAFGFGIDRLAAVRHQLADVRELLVNDLRFLEQF